MLKKCYFFLILDLILGKVKKFLVESSLLQKLSAKNLTGASPSAFRVNGKITPFNVKKTVCFYFHLLYVSNRISGTAKTIHCNLLLLGLC